MPKAAMEGKVCINHPDSSADSRCTSCFKPICNACIITVQDEDFCSKTCTNNHFQNEAHLENLKKRQGKRGGSLIKIIIYLIILIALCVGIYFFILKKA